MKHHWDDNDYAYYCSLLALAVLLAAGGVYLTFFSGSRVLSGCRFYRTFHLYCPACGGTRALGALLRGDLLSCAYYYPPLAYAAVLLPLYWVCQTWYRITRRPHRFMGRWDSRWVQLGLWLLLLNWVARNVLLVGFYIPL